MSVTMSGTVIRSEGENFCNGADVLEFAKLVSRKYFCNLAIRTLIVFVFWKLVEFPTLLRWQGMAVGVGLTCPCVRFFLVVEASATLFSMRSWASCYRGRWGSQRIADRLGRARTCRMMMLAEPISGEQLEPWGIATN